MYYTVYYCINMYVTKYVHFNNEVFLELSNDENLLRKILLLTNGNFYEGSIDHIIVNNLIKTQSYYHFKSNYSLKLGSLLYI